MIQIAANAIINFLSKQKVIHMEDREVYVYGCDLALYTFLSTSGLLLIGFYFGFLLETVVCVSLFYLNQSKGGGYHATSHRNCFLTMVIGLFAYLIVLSLEISVFVCALVGCVSLLLLFLFPLVLHKNKQHLHVRRIVLVKQSRAIVIIQFVAVLAALLMRIYAFVQMLSLSLALCALSRCTAVCLRRIEFHTNLR